MADVSWPDWLTFTPPSTAHEAFASGKKNAHRAVAMEILRAVSGISLLGPPGGVLWRGHADAAWRIESKASRVGLHGGDLTSHEERMIKHARDVGVDDPQRLGDWEILARLRHHGAATRLLDCTTDPFVALWFLCDDDGQAEDKRPLRTVDGALVALQREAFGQISDSRADSYGELSQKRPAALRFAVPPLDRRISAQRGLFVLHSHPLAPPESALSELGVINPPSAKWLDEHEKNFSTVCAHRQFINERGRPRTIFPSVIRILVPAAVKQIILTMLRLNFGFERATIYPDVSGIAQMYAKPHAR